MPDPRDPKNLQNAENNQSAYIGGGDTGRLEQAGAYHGSHRAEDLGNFQPMPGEMAQAEREREEGRDVKDTYDQARDIKDKAKDIKEGIDKAKQAKSGEGAVTPGEGAGAPGSGTGAGTGAAGEGAAAPGAASTGGAGATAPGAAAAPGTAAAAPGAAGAGAGGASGAGGAAGAGAGAGTGAAAGATGGAAGGAAAGAAGTGAAAGASTAATAGTAAGAAAGGAAAGGAATGGAVAAGTAAGTAATAAGSATGVGAPIGAAVGAVIVAGTLTAAFAYKHRNSLMGFAFLSFVGVLLLFTAFLNALKPIASTISTAQKYLGPASTLVNERSISILGRFASGGSAVAMAQAKETVAQSNGSGGHVLAATSDGPVTQGKLASLFDAMRKDGFEERIKQNYGLEFKGAGANGVDIVWKGKSLGTAKNGDEARGVLEAFFPDLQRLLDEEMQSWSWTQHMKVARNLKRYYSIPGLYVPGGEKASTPDELVDVVKYKVSTILAPGLSNMTQAIQCYTTGNGCNDTNEPVEATAEPDFQSNADSGIATATQKAYDDNLNSISPDNDYDTERLDDSANANVKKDLGQKAIGIIGWLDITASMTDLATKEKAQQLPVMLRQKQSGALWTWNLSAVNQMIPGDMSPVASSLIARNYSNIEDSQAYNYVAYDDTSRGLGMKDELKINNIMAAPFKYELDLIKANPIFKLGLTTALEFWLFFRRHTPASFILNIAANTPLGQVANRFLGAAFDKIGLTDFIEQTLGVSSSQTLPICDQADKSYNFFNCMATGAKTAANEATVDQLGGADITNEENNELLAYDAKRQQASLAWRPLNQRLFDKALPNSFINVAAMQSPIPIKATQNVASFVQGIFGAIWKAPENVAAIAARPAHAANSNSSDIDGQKHEGVPLKIIRQTVTVPTEMTTQDGTCPEVATNQYNPCDSYSATIDGLIGRYTYNPDYTGN